MDQKKHKKALMASLIAAPLLMVLITAAVLTGVRVAPIDAEKVKAATEKPPVGEMDAKSFVNMEAKRNPLPSDIKSMILKVEGVVLFGFILLTVLAYRPKEWSLRLITVVDVMMLAFGLAVFADRITSTMKGLKGLLAAKQLLFFSMPVNYIHVADVMAALSVIWVAWAITVLYFAMALLHEESETPDANVSPAEA
ncbi:MAG: hypothetical protein R6V10_05155 [bacterium]